MARPRSKHPTELELAILKVIWEQGPQPVKEVRQGLRPARKLAYTTVMTMMNIMVDKGYLSREKKGARYVYQPEVSMKTTMRGILRDMVNRVFDGSAAAVMVNLLESADLDEAETRKLRQLLKRKSGEETQ